METDRDSKANPKGTDEINEITDEWNSFADVDPLVDPPTAPEESFEIMEDGDLRDPPLSRDLIRDVEWKGNILKLYPLDYRKVPMVKYQVLASFIMFAVFGFNDQSVGTLLPTLMEYYNATKVQVSNIFLIQLSGYICASFLNERVHNSWGMRGGMFVAAALCIVFFSILMSKPSKLPIFMFCCFPLGLGIGILDASCNVLVGNMLVHKNELMGIMHAVYGCAAMLTPPLVAHFVKWGHWSMYFVIPFLMSVIGACIIVPSFRFETAAKYHYICEQDENDNPELTPDATTSEQPPQKESFLSLLSMPPILLYALFLFAYLGAEITTGAWFYTYLLETKSTDQIKMSYIASTFWIGLTAGRLVLGFVTKRAFSNEYRACRVYCGMTVFFYTLYVLVGWINSESMSYLITLSLVMFCCGFFIGPLFPSASIVAVQVLPNKLQISGVGIAVAFGGCGGAILPYSAGIITHWIGIEWLPTICWLLVAIFSVIWMLYPKYIKGHDDAL
ncbi:similar to Saccharomyces cerevisiae YOL137W BSC6 Protein of unknown function containing 8 putative transmembrane seqments [Maudiozyma saulgeensis]|uniref:Major facilitator superfamily (MFS) profile domain-containing protein n=1 Tax=Maudiozyma saulgeensis TaxID=1789683 RepID=A0A1X7RA03_9SACH|nr:similar to Saccharomyces cerevisiae YOL137W BSC6 Protein of unknown function containing 8 putative transmembrane seqments [Kazachstania saulgeensis]